MTATGRVSIVVPFLDAERFIGEAIESVLAQTYGDWELLLVDDGSSDRSTEIARQYAARQPWRITYVTHADRRTRGPAVTRNLGIAHVAGEYVAFLDADDVWLPQKLEQQTALLAAQPQAGMVYGASQYWYSWSGKTEDRDRDYFEPVGVPTGVLIRPPSLVRASFVLQKAAIPTPTSVLVRRRLIEQIGGFEESVPPGYEDQAFHAKACVHASIFVAAECWDRYRQHPDSLTSVVSSRGEEAAARRRFLTWLIGYLDDQGIDGDLRGALRRQRLRYAHAWLDRIAESLRRDA